MQKIMLLLVVLLGGICASAQQAPYGDTARARAMAHGAPRTGTNPHIQLGYLDSDTATRQEFLDNLEVGLRSATGTQNGFAITQYMIALLCPGRDLVVSNKIKGNKIPLTTYKDLGLGYLMKGTTVWFEGIKVKSGDYPERDINSVKVVIR